MATKSISDQLRRQLLRSKQSRYRLSQVSGINESVLSRFVNEKSELTIANAERLCKVLGIQLVIEQLDNDRISKYGKSSQIKK